MLNLINITQARNNLSKLIDNVVAKKTPVILIRESVPQAVILPYELYQKQENDWKEEFEKCLTRARRQFKKYLKNQNIPYPKTEEEMYGLIGKLSGRP